MQGLWLWVILKVPPKCLAGVHHKMLAPQWHIRGYFMCLPYGLRDLCMTRLGSLALNGYGNRVVNILIGSVCNIGWRIVGRQAIWWEEMLTLDLHKMEATRTFQRFACLTYHI
ncbi:hypothetical protein GmHk_12G034881 [Glycine max]|nr:hypothetical protein GmHk_12G034881 [Glycine max]